MGAQTPARLSQYIDRYEALKEAGEAPYFYGSHYSTPLGCVLYYLVRLEPFTQFHVLLQDHHFDVR